MRSRTELDRRPWVRAWLAFCIVAGAASQGDADEPGRVLLTGTVVDQATLRPGSRPAAGRDRAGTRALLDRPTARGRSRPFAGGFLASLTVAISAYLVACLMVPDVVRAPLEYDINEIEPYLYDADLAVAYRPSLEVHGLILGLPQCLLALGGGVVAEAVAGEDRAPVAAGCPELIPPPGP